MAPDEWLKGLLSSGNYSDCTVICGEDEYKLHKAVVCSQSSFFKKAFSIDMKEKATSSIKLDGDCPKAVKSMIDWMYTKDYQRPQSSRDAGQTGVVVGTEAPCDCLASTAIASFDSWGSPQPQDWGTRRKKRKDPATSGFLGLASVEAPSGDHALLLHHAKVYALGDFHALEDLRTLAATKFRENCAQGCTASKFPEAAYVVYNTTPEADRGLRDIVVETILQHRKLIDKPEVQSVIEQTKLGFDLVMEAHKRGTHL